MNAIADATAIAKLLQTLYGFQVTLVRTRVVSTSQKMHAERIPTSDPLHMAGHESLGDFIFVPRAL